MMGKLDDAIKKIDDIHIILTGNGHPEAGLVFKVAQNTKFVNFWERFWGLILTASIGVPFTILTGIVVFKLTH